MHKLVTLVTLCLIGTGTSGTHITLKSKPGALFSIPLEFGTGTLSQGAPSWVKYEGGTLKGVAGDPGLYKFQLSEDDGTSVTVDIGVGPRETSAEMSQCSIQKAFSRILSLDEKLSLGIPGGVYIDGPAGSVLHYPTPCKVSRRRHARQSDDDDEDVLGSGSDEEEYDEEPEEEVERRVVPILPTPTFDFEPSMSSSTAEYGQPTPIISPTSTINTYAASDIMSPDLYIPIEIGSGDFEITPSSPIMTFPSSTPIVEVVTPTLGPEEPIQRKKIERLLLPGGKVFKFDISDGYFTASNPITYTLEAFEREPLPDWVTLENGALVAWPSQNDVTDHNVVLVAQDSVTKGRASAKILLSVRQSSKTRNYNHEFELEFRKSGGSENVLLYEVIQKVHQFAGGRGEDDLVVFRIEKESGIYKLKWVNETILVGENLSKCPTKELSAIFSRLATSAGAPRPELRDFLSPAFNPISVAIHLAENSVCGGVKPSDITGWKPQTPPKENFQPRIANQIDWIDAVVGEYLIFKVPDNFCHDPEDGETRYLKLDLVDRNYAEVGNDSWLQFDKKNQEFYGLPPLSGAESKVNIEEWYLKCSDLEGKSAHDALEIKIHPRSKTDYSAEFFLRFQSPAGFNAPEIRKFIQTLAKSFNDSLSNIVVKSYQQSPPTVHVVWFNKTNPSTEFELTALRRVMFSDDGPKTAFKSSFSELFKSEGFNLSDGQVIPRGRMIGQGTFTNEGDLGAGDAEVVPPPDVTVVSGASEEGTYLITYIIPSVLIAVMVLLAALIACLLSRKRKSIPSSKEEGRAFIKKGVPVIFQEEYEEDKGARSRSPAILREEHPPLPPEYRRSPIEQYQPPPPLSKATGPRGVRPGANYRRPPPYVPP